MCVGGGGGGGVIKIMKLIVNFIFFLDSDWHWQSIDDSVVCPVSPGRDIRKDLIEKYDLCLTGEVSH